MRFTVLALAGVAAFIVAGVAGSQVPGVYERATFRGQLIDVREDDRHRANIVQLYSPSGTLPIGHSVLDCHKLGEGGILGGGVASCVGTYVLPLGKIAVSGLVHSFSRYTLVITGGTGRYEDADGSLFTRRSGPGQRLVVFTFR